MARHPEPAPAWLDELHLNVGPPWHVMGTRALGGGPWLIVDDDRAAQLALKRSLLREVPDVVAASLPGMAQAEVEAAELVSRTVEQDLDPDRPPLEAAALLVQEDLCLLARYAGRWRLESGVVCFPSLWRLRDKLGLPIAAVHDPVPGYDEELADRVDHFLDHLSPSRPAWRRNWFVHDTAELHLPEPVARHGPTAVPEDLWIRSERQTLRLLPASGAILFTIRTQQAPLAVMTRRPDLAAAMAPVIRQWPAAIVAYRRADTWRDAAVAWLDRL